MKALDISLEIWYAESMKVEFTEQELAIVAYGLEDHISVLNREIKYLDELVGFDTRTVAMRKLLAQARSDTQYVLAKVEEMIYNA